MQCLGATSFPRIPQNPLSISHPPSQPLQAARQIKYQTSGSRSAPALVSWEDLEAEERTLISLASGF